MVDIDSRRIAAMLSNRFCQQSSDFWSSLSHAAVAAGSDPVSGDLARIQDEQERQPGEDAPLQCAAAFGAE
jgi:hypothetical protein